MPGRERGWSGSAGGDLLVGDGVGLVDELLHITVADYLGDYRVDEVQKVLVALFDHHGLAVGIVGDLAEDGQVVLGFDVTPRPPSGP